MKNYVFEPIERKREPEVYYSVPMKIIGIGDDVVVFEINGKPFSLKKGEKMDLEFKVEHSLW